MTGSDTTGDVESELQSLAWNTRVALRRLAKAVVVITARHDGQRFAMAATAVSELSMEPPSVLVCANRAASIHVALSAGAPFCINILHASHEPIARQCSGAVKGEARFAEGEWRDGANGTPYLIAAQASLACFNETFLSYGTHGVFIGRVVEVFCSGPVDPLVYCDGRYVRLPV